MLTATAAFVLGLTAGVVLASAAWRAVLTVALREEVDRDAR